MELLFSCSRLLLLVFSLFVTTDCQQENLDFVTNAGEGRYRLEYNETYITPDGNVIVGPPPPGFFSIRCLLNNQPSNSITYAKTDDDADGGLFQVNSSTGAFSLQEGRLLDYETTTSYQFGVNCTSPLTAEIAIAQVDFDVLPVNEFEPIVIPRRLTVLANEMDPVGRVLVSRALFSAIDEDTGPDGELTYSLFDSENLTSFAVDSTTGTLTIAQTLDVDDRPQGFFSETIRLTVCDINPPVSSCPNLDVNIIILPANDNSPVFSQDVYQVSIRENATLNTVLTTVSCTDADVGSGTFENITSSSNLFNINITSGTSQQTLILNRQLDFETARMHDITLTCYDDGGLNTTASLIVTVEPVNDNPPLFSTDTYFFSMDRAETTGSEIGRVVATDADEAVGGQLTYTLNGNENFQIQGDGRILLTDFVYVVEGQVFMLEAGVSDGEFSATATVSITVNGVLSIPEIILVCMGALIFLVLVIFVIIFCCYCCVCCSRLLPKQRHIDVEREVVIPNKDAIGMVDPMAMPMTVMGGDMFNQGKGPTYMIGQIPSAMGWMGEEESEDDLETGSIATASSRVYSPTPYLKEMVDMFKDGDEVLEGKKSKTK